MAHVQDGLPGRNELRLYGTTFNSIIGKAQFNMKIPHNDRRSVILPRLLLLVCLVLAFITACGVSGTTNPVSNTHPLKTPTPQVRQPITGQQIISGPVTYVALGASDAVGVGSNQPGSQGYVPLIESRLPTGSHLVNLGISGIQLHEALARELPLALTTSPSLITIWLVVNDFVGGVSYNSYTQDLNSLLKQLRAGTKARIVLANIPDLTLLPDFSRSSANQKATILTAIKKWNSAIADISAHYNVTVIDLFSHESQLTAHPEYISGDGFHPSAAGYVQLANYFWQAISSS